MAEVFGSINEENIYLALEALKIEFRYQVPLDGGRAVRGGQVIDFVVYVPPRPIALYVQGERWHTGKFALEEILKHDRAEKAGYEVLEVWEHECMTIEDAKAVIERKVV